MSENKTRYEVAGDITIAMINKMVIERRNGSDGYPEVTPEYLAPKIAAAYKLIYAAVTEATQGK